MKESIKILQIIFQWESEESFGVLREHLFFTNRERSFGAGTSPCDKKS